MAMIVVSSSAIRAVEYHPQKKELDVYFTDGDSRIYIGVPVEIYNSLMDAKSIGGYFNAVIRDGFKHR